jgi:hypothetical protein
VELDLIRSTRLVLVSVNAGHAHVVSVKLRDRMDDDREGKTSKEHLGFGNSDFGFCVG